MDKNNVVTNGTRDEEKKDIPYENQILIGEEKSEAIAQKDSALKRLDTTFNKHIELNEFKKSNILAYWIKDFSNYHDNEKYFNPNTLKRYRRGDIIKVNLGFNVGNELGGLHYCVVLNKNDSMSSGTLTVVPLSSNKENKKYHANTVNLGDELYQLLNKKFTAEAVQVYKELSELEVDASPIEATKELTHKLHNLAKIKAEVSRMKSGSIALVNQITTISKQRIYNPKNNSDILANIRLSKESSMLIDNKIAELFMKKI